VPGESSRLARGVHWLNALRALRPPLASALRAAGKASQPSASPPSPPGELQGVRPAPLAARAGSAASGGPVSAWQRSAGLGRDKARCLEGTFPHPPRLGRVEGRRACCRWRVSSSALSIAEWVHKSTVATFPAPATSNAACGFPALRFPARFMPRVMGLILLGALSAVVGAPGSC
jgi:hypothetical protein